MTLHLTSIVSHHEPEDATQRPAPKPGECDANKRPPAVRPQSLAREAYVAAWHLKESLR